MARHRSLRLPPHEKDQKTGLTIRASEKCLRRLDLIRMALIRSMYSDGNVPTPNWPFDFNRDAALRLILRVFARDYGISLDEQEKDECPRDQTDNSE